MGLASFLARIDQVDERIDAWFSSPRYESATEQRVSTTDWGPWQGDAPMPVSPDGALKLLAVSGSVQLLAESIATLPIDVFRKTNNGRSTANTPPWLVEPVVGLTFVDWCTQVLTSLLLHGNCYLVVTRDTSGRVMELTPVDPRDVTTDRGGSMGGRLRYIVRGAPFNGEIVHIRGMMLPGHDVGLSPLDFARVSIESGLAAQQYGLDNFNTGLKMPGVIEFPGAVDPTKMAETARLWQRARRKGAHGLPGVLEGGGKFNPIGITNEAAQFLESRQWTAAEICAQVYLIDPRELGIPLTGSTLEYVNSESRMANLVRKGMLRWIVRIEAALTALLPSPQYFKFNVNGFMRGDASERWDTYLKASQINATATAAGMAPVLLTDEMRAWEELDPLPAVEPPEPPPVVVDDADKSDDAMRLLVSQVAELRAASTQPAPTINITNTPPAVEVRNEFTMPDIDVDARSEPPVVNVTTPEVVVNMPAPEVVEARAVRKTIEHTADGRIAAIIEEPV